MPSTTDVFAIRAARPPPTQVAFEIPRARRIPRRSPPCWATTWAARDQTTAASVGSRCWSSQCVSASGSFIAGATRCEYPKPQLLLRPCPVAECLRTPRSPTLRRHAGGPLMTGAVPAALPWLGDPDRRVGVTLLWARIRVASPQHREHRSAVRRGRGLETSDARRRLTLGVRVRAR